MLLYTGQRWRLSSPFLWDGQCYWYVYNMVTCILIRFICLFNNYSSKAKWILVNMFTNIHETEANNCFSSQVIIEIPRRWKFFCCKAVISEVDQEQLARTTDYFSCNNSRRSYWLGRKISIKNQDYQTKSKLFSNNWNLCFSLKHLLFKINFVSGTTCFRITKNGGL